jgi:NAD(P)-dependent dehydrogenase (short-subunit alcohol dehydrogenase family)
MLEQLLKDVYARRAGAVIGCALVMAGLWRLLGGARARARVADMSGKVAIITGASSGIGRALAICLAARGVKLTLAARGKEALESVAEEVGGAHVVPTDVTDAKECEQLVSKAVAHHGRVDIFVSCAGIGHHGLATDDDIAMQRKLFEVNHFGTVHCVKAVLPHLNKSGQKPGEILVVSIIAFPAIGL